MADVTAFENGTNKKSVEVAEKVLRKLKKELLEVIDDSRRERRKEQRGGEVPGMQQAGKKELL